MSMETMTLKREAEAMAAGNFEKALYLKWQINALNSSLDTESALSLNIGA